MSRQSILDLIGETPLVELHHLSPKTGIRLLAKLEGQNPSGSIKDRIVRAMVEAAEIRGDLTPGQTIVEASTGNTGIALAMVARQKGYRAIVIIPKGAVHSMEDLLRAFGAEVIWCEPRGGMQGAIDLAKSLAEERGHYCLSQFTDSINCTTHYSTTGTEILHQAPDVDVFVAGTGTGGTLMGVGQKLREANPNVRIIGVEPRLGERLQGLRSLEEGFIPPLLDLTQLDSRLLVDSASAIAATRSVIETEGIVAGISSGATLHAALRIAERMDRATIVMMFADGGWKYLPSRPWDAAEAASSKLDETYWW